MELSIDMELFSEIYGCYYQAVRKILDRAHDGITEEEMRQISDETGFAESSLYILSKLLDGEWQLLDKQQTMYYAKTKHNTPFYITLLQQRFLKSLLEDKRIRLFLTDSQIQETQMLLRDVEPLFASNDFHYFDQFQDGDPYEDEQYIQNFRKIHCALREKNCLDILYKNNNGMETYLPVYLEYSAKNDKFRLYAVKLIKGKLKQPSTLNVSSIKEINLLNETFAAMERDAEVFLEKHTRWEKVHFLLFDTRNALERCTLQFSSYKKHIRYREEENCYECTMYYDKSDEKEIVIRLLSFGPLIQVTAPENFVGMIKKRVFRQRRLLHQIEEQI